MCAQEQVGCVLGGRVKVAVTGGGPISADVQNFIRVAMHFNLVQVRAGHWVGRREKEAPVWPESE